jgi:pilus assembly protein CpaC
LNLFLFRPDLNLGATIEALESKNLLQILAEPNVLAMNGKQASFISGGEFPVPVVQGGANVGAVTIQFREFGVKLNFLPTITPRGTIRLVVAPEVSSLDYADALTVEGGTVPALTTRKVETEVELEDGQSFAIAGLLDQQTTDTLSKIPGLSDIPILGKLFTSKSVTKSNSELVIIVTPEIVAAIPKGQPTPELKFPEKFLDGPGVATTAPRTPGTDVTGPAPQKPPRTEISVQEMEKIQLEEQEQKKNGSGGTQSPTNGLGSNNGSGGGGGAGAAPAGTITLPIQVPMPANPGLVNQTPQVQAQ